MWVGSSLWWKPGITTVVRIKGWQSPAKVSTLDPAKINPETSDTKVQYLSLVTPPGTITHLQKLYT
jgi:hypothetical protein